MSIHSFLPSDLDNRTLYGFFTSAIIPRPIAFVSTINLQGGVNLSPFSYFNVVSTRPPILIFAPVRQVRDGKQKDTYENIKEVAECVIHLVHYELAEKMNITSAPFPMDVNEFIEAGLTEMPSDLVKPPRVKECKLAFECKVNQIVELGKGGGAGSLMICEILKIHVDQDILTDKNKIDALKLGAIGRLGSNQYVRITAENLFDMERPE